MFVVRARWCQSYFCRLRGLMFSPGLAPETGLLIVQPSMGVSQTAIHMWFVFFSLGVVWLDDEYRVVDKKLAKPWRIYAPKAAARYILEGRPELLEKVKIGDKLDIAPSSD
ncbi:MAG: DUF192 domain-containing protein [Anaerolineales bacterium]